MVARNKNIFSIIQSELNPSDSNDDDESPASSEDEYVLSDEADSVEEYIEEDLHYSKGFEPEDEELLNKVECLRAIHQDKCSAIDGTKRETAVSQRHRTQQHSVVRCRAKPKYLFGVLIEFLQAFRLYLSNHILEKILLHTNAKAKRIYQEKQSRTTRKLTEKTKILAYIGLVIAAGHLKQNHLRIEKIWYKKIWITCFPGHYDKIQIQSINSIYPI